MHLFEDKVAGIFSKARVDLVEEFCNVFNLYSEIFGISKKLHIDFLLAQLREEVGPNLEPRRESLNYSCESLEKTFRYYRQHPQEALSDGRCNGHIANQRKIANKVYANRIGNGNYTSGDGYRFRGGGFIQLTGRLNYSVMAGVISETINKKITAEDVETEISTITMGLLSAFAFWKYNNLSECVHIDQVTSKINRYTDSYDKRRRFFLQIANIDNSEGSLENEA